jgi:ribosomal protein S18 acetylase RimI-like enzyme
MTDPTAPPVAAPGRPPAPVTPSALPAGLGLRRPQRSDRDALLALCVADEVAATGSATVSAADIDELLAPAHTRLEEDQWLVVDQKGRVCAWGLVWDDGATDHQEVDVYRDPRLAPERVRAAVLKILVRRMGQRARAAGYPSIVAVAGCIDGDVVYAQTLRACGFAHVRTFHHLRIDLGDEPIATTPPVGVDIATFDPEDEAMRRAVHAVLDEGFADHWEHVAVDYPAWRAARDAEPHPDLEFWRVAHTDSHVVGVLRASGRATVEDGGAVAELTVMPTHRGHGVARALLVHCFEAYRSDGRTFVRLGVDTGNTTGALSLYESVGMRPERVIHAYQRDVLPEPQTEGDTPLAPEHSHEATRAASVLR